MNQRSCLFAIILLGVYTGLGHSEVIENDAVLAPDYSPPDVENLFFLTESTSDGGLVAFGINDLGNDEFLFFHQGIAELIAGYEVPFGTVFDEYFVTNNPPLVQNDGITGTVNLAVGESFYFGYYDDRADFEIGNSYGPDAEDNYGWALITRTNSGLELNGSATAINYGIIVGTTIQVPEPSFSATAVALILLAGRKRRRTLQ